MRHLVLMRHGESLWNRANRFTGWTDVDVSHAGIQQAREAGRLLKGARFTFDIAFTSVLKRAIRTLWIVLDEMNLMWIPVHQNWRLNERHYGALQGLNKAETAERFGREQVKLWRRSYAVRPPALENNDPRHPCNDVRYAGLDPSLWPVGESLEDTVARFQPYWKEVIAPAVRSGRRVLIVSHGNSQRALAKYLDRISDEGIVNLDIPTGVPLVYELDDDLRPVGHHYLTEGQPDARDPGRHPTDEKSA